MRLQTLAEARWIFVILLVLVVASWLISPWLSLLFVVLTVYTLAFFRDPERIARRIVGWAKVGDQLKKGERFGMIRFGSRTEVYLPLSASVLVKAGDRVSGGSTIIARLAD